MLRELVPRSHRSYQQSPWAQELEEFGNWLHATGYSRDSLRGHLFRLKRAMERTEGVRPGATFTPLQLSRAFRSGPSSQAVLYRATQHAYQRFLETRARLTVPPTFDPFSALRLDYRQYLAELRGFAATTIQQHDATVREFLSRALEPHRSLADLNSADQVDSNYHQGARSARRPGHAPLRPHPLRWFHPTPQLCPDQRILLTILLTYCLARDGTP